MHDDWIDLFRLLRGNSVRYLVIGGYAVAFYGFERYTKDIDIWIARDEENASAIVSALVQFGYPARSLDTKAFLNPRKVVVLGAEPFRVDILTALDAMDFETAWPDRLVRKNKGVPINYVSIDHLRLLKTGTGRFVDQRDLEALAYCQVPRSRKSARGSATKRSKKSIASTTKPARKTKRADPRAKRTKSRRPKQ